MTPEGKRHKHNVRSLELKWKPRQGNYTVFLVEFPVRAFAYCLQGRCAEYSPDSLSSRVAKALAIPFVDKGKMLKEFSRRNWLLDLYVSKNDAGRLQGQGPDKIARRLSFLKDLMADTMGVFPSRLLPAMKHNPSEDECRRGRSFGSRVFEAIEDDIDLASRFRPIHISPWRDGYAGKARRALGLDS